MRRVVDWWRRYITTCTAAAAGGGHLLLWARHGFHCRTAYTAAPANGGRVVGDHDLALLLLPFVQLCGHASTLLEQLIIHVLFALCVAILHQHARARSADASGNNKMRAAVDRICDHTVDFWSTRDVPTNL